MLKLSYVLVFILTLLAIGPQANCKDIKYAGKIKVIIEQIPEKNYEWFPLIRHAVFFQDEQGRRFYGGLAATIRARRDDPKALHWMYVGDSDFATPDLTGPVSRVFPGQVVYVEGTILPSSSKGIDSLLVSKVRKLK